MDPDGGWLKRLRLDEFALLNESWAGRVESLEEAAEAMHREGFDRLAPIAFGLEFDPAYYRIVHPEYADLADAAGYARWLLHDLQRGWPGSPAQHLAQLGLSFRSYPAAFDWRGYIEDRADAGPNAWSALVHLLDVGLPADTLPPVAREGAAAFWYGVGYFYRNRDDGLAVRAFDRARAYGDTGCACAHELGDALFRLGRFSEATRLFEAAAQRSEAGVWTFVNGVRAALHTGAVERAFALIEHGRSRVAGDPLLRTVLEEAVEAEFWTAGDAAKRLYAEDRGPEADTLLQAAVERTAERWRTLDPLGPPLRRRPDGPVLILANTDLRQCTHYRVEQKAELLSALGREHRVFDARTETEAFLTALPGASAAICYRLPAFPHNVRAIEAARALGVPTFYDIDDLIFEPAHYPEPFDTYGGEITPEFYRDLQFGAPLFRAAMALCDHGIASTPSLAEHMRPVVRTSRVSVLPNGLDSRNLGFFAATPARVRRDDAVVVFYGSGTKAHNSDFLDLAGPALLEHMTADPRVRLLVAGHLTLDERFTPFADRITDLPWTDDIADYWSVLAEADINIAVLARYPTTDAKSEIKWLEAAALGVPSVVSDTARYREVLTDGVDALVAGDAAEWSAKLGQLIASPEGRAEIATAARAKAASDYGLTRNAARLAECLAPAWKAAAVASTKPKVMLVNIFFPPQTVGGSTRVVRDNLDRWLDGPGAEAFDFAVFASEDRNPVPYRLRVEPYRGVPVFRASTPEGDTMDWAPDFPDVGAIFARALAAWRPDLVHFHALSRLSASVVQACRDAGVPYVVTVHDAWWISDWHFLVDAQGRVREPCEPLPDNPPAGVSVGESLRRRRTLRDLLLGAAAVLGVSESFSEIYRRCGFDVRALPNGVPVLTPAPRRPSAGGRVRLCHVGSQTRHKGYHLVEAALKQGAFANLELTVVEHGRYGGEVFEAVWGATPVRLVGKTRGEAMAEFYAGQDVLLAPSIWPESYGLVAREALACGLRVVAGDRGAMGEDVTPGVNGWIVDVSGASALTAVLAEMDADPERFLSPPPPTTLRPASAQADELLEVYRALIQGPAVIRRS